MDISEFGAIFIGRRPLSNIHLNNFQSNCYVRCISNNLVIIMNGEFCFNLVDCTIIYRLISKCELIEWYIYRLSKQLIHQKAKYFSDTLLFYICFGWSLFFTDLLKLQSNAFLRNTWFKSSNIVIFLNFKWCFKLDVS